MELNYSLIVFNARSDPETNQPKLETQVRLYRDGEPFYTGPVKPLLIDKQTDLQQVVAGGAVALGLGLKPGSYTLQLTVTDALIGDQKFRTQTRWIDFDVVE
jgi:hypothetical protein